MRKRIEIQNYKLKIDQDWTCNLISKFNRQHFANALRHQQIKVAPKVFICTSTVCNNVLQLFWGTLMSLFDVVVRSALGKLLDQLSGILYALQFIWNMRHNYLRYLMQFIWNMWCVYQFSTPQSIFLMGLKFLELTKELKK